MHVFRFTGFHCQELQKRQNLSVTDGKEACNHKHVFVLDFFFLETYDQAPVLCLFRAAVHKPLHPADPVNIKQQDACTYNYILQP